MATMNRPDGHVPHHHHVVDRVARKKKGKSYCRIHPLIKRRPRPPHQFSISMALQNLFDSCRQIFKGPGTVPAPQDVHRLCSILDGMKPEDVGLSSDLQFFKPNKMTMSSRNVHAEERPRVTSATIYKCEFFELCIFFLPTNAVIPLHNHPGMTVFSKLLLGTMHVKSYDWVDPPQYPTYTSSSSSSSRRRRLAEMKANRTMASPCSTSVLFPTTGGNIHEFTAVTPCAMLDVLGPPYSDDDGHDCSYYKDYPLSAEKEEVEEDESLVRLYGKENNGEEGSGSTSGYGWLEEIQIPGDLEMEGIAYMGPKFILG